MKYIHVIESFSLEGGGVKSVVEDVSKQMAKDGDDVYVLAMSVPEGFTVQSMKEWSRTTGVHGEVISTSQSWWQSIRYVHRRIKELCREDDCCLYLHLKRGVLCGILATLEMKNIRRVEVYHSGYMNYKLQAFLCRPFIDQYLSVSKEGKEQLVRQFGAKESKVKVAYNGVDVEKLRAMATDLRPDRQNVRLLTVGRLAYQKNIFLSVEAFARLKEAGKAVGAEYLIAGDGPDRQELEEKAKGQVTFLGMIGRDQVYSHIASADVVVFPSLWEGNSIALLETLAIGCALVVTDIPSFREVLGNNPLTDTELFRPEPFGAVFHKDRVESCMAALEYVCTHQAELPAMRNVVARLADNFTVVKQAEVYRQAATIKKS